MIQSWAMLAFIAFVPSAPLVAFGIRAWAFEGERKRGPLMVLLGLVCGVVFCVANVKAFPSIPWGSPR